MKKIFHQPGQILILFLFVGDILSQNNVGIGTLAPANRLDVQGDPANSNSINVNSKVNYTGSVDIKAFDGYSVTADGYGIGGQFTGGYRGIDIAGLGGTYTGIVYGVYSNATGTAGTRYGVYGTASGGTANYGIYGAVTGGSGFYGVFGQNTNPLGYAGYFNGRGAFVDELRTNDNLIVDDNVGIGTLTPGAKLQIIGGLDAGLGSNGYAQFGPSSSWNLVFDDNEIFARSNGLGGDLLMQQDDGNILMCGLDQGQVGIGVQLATDLPPGYMLAVDGKIIGEELRIQNYTNWPDYVFADHYELMPLDALKQSIEEQNHLPNIPSAEVVAQEGILVGDMQKRMMEKIEELTLYILDLHETNKNQQAEIELLKTTIAEIRER